MRVCDRFIPFIRYMYPNVLDHFHIYIHIYRYRYSSIVQLSHHHPALSRLSPCRARFPIILYYIILQRGSVYNVRHSTSEQSETGRQNGIITSGSGESGSRCFLRATALGRWKSIPSPVTITTTIMCRTYRFPNSFPPLYTL